MVAGWRACRHAFVMDTGLGPEGSGLTVDAGARRVAMRRKTLRVWLMAKVSTKSVPAQTFFEKESLIKETCVFSFSTGFLFSKKRKSVWRKRLFSVASEAY